MDSQTMRCVEPGGAPFADVIGKTKLLGAKKWMFLGILLVTKGIATRSKDASSPGLITSNKKLLVARSY